MIVGSKTVSGVRNGLTSIIGEARNDGKAFSSSFVLLHSGTAGEYDVGDFRVRARRLLNHIYQSNKKICMKAQMSNETYLNSIFFNIQTL